MTTFSEILRMISDGENLSCKKMIDMLNANDVKVCRSGFYRYYRGESVPKLSRAVLILKTFKYEIGDEDVAEILVESEKKLDTKHLKREMFFTSIKVNYRKIIDSPDTKELLNLRIKQTSSGVTDYIVKLIRKDLNEGILKEGEDYGIKKILWIKE